MNETKSMWASKTVWGALVTLLSLGLNLVGNEIAPPDQVALIDALTKLGIGVSAVWTWWGRVSATDRIE